MGLFADYAGPDINIKNCYVKIERIWGSKNEGWNAFISVLKNKDSVINSSIFSISAPYKDGENPFTILYNEIEKLSFLSNISHDIEDVKKQKTKIKIKS